MTIINAVALGIVQGITEFLPISSDGHLVVAEHVLGLAADDGSMLDFDIILHLGSLIAILICYMRVWCRIVASPFNRDRETVSLLILIVIATVPGAAAGLLFKDVVATTLRDPFFAGLGFIMTAFVVLIADAGTRGTLDRPSYVGGFLIGCAQALAILPGLSRSGSTIATGRLLKLSRAAAVDFSFLMAAPIIAGAGLAPAIDVIKGESSLPTSSVLIAGFIASLVTSVGAIAFLKMWVRRFSVGWFALYLLPLGVLLIVF